MSLDHSLVNESIEIFLFGITRFKESFKMVIVNFLLIRLFSSFQGYL